VAPRWAPQPEPRGGARRLGAAALAATALAGCGGERASGPNLLLVTVDTLRADRLACYGGEPGAGAALCALGERGIRYVWAFSAAPSTAPAIASVLTSRYPSSHGVSQLLSTSLAQEARTLAEELDAAGYDAAAFVSNPVLAPERALDQGFEIYDAKMTRRERNRPGLAEREAAATSEAALAWLSVAREPWFLWVHYQDPHGPFDPPGAPPARDAPGAHVLPVLRDHSGRGGIPAYQELPGVRGVETYQARYRAELDYLDAELARLLAAAGSGTRPVGILATADHGEAFGEDGYWFAHGHSLGIDQIRVPLLWRPPGGSAAASVLEPVSTLDVAPTLLAAAGLPAPSSFQGLPLPGADPSGPHAARPLFAEHSLRAAVLAGGLYYARDRSGFTEPVPDRISGGELTPLPPRLARLGSEGRMPDYEPFAGATGEALEHALADFLGASDAALESASGEIPAQARERLEALGYLE
jgi:arylsulfatase A-like enzyme